MCYIRARINDAGQYVQWDIVRHSYGRGGRLSGRAIIQVRGLCCCVMFSSYIVWVSPVDLFKCDILKYSLVTKRGHI